MSKIPVTIVNASERDASVGAGTTLITVPAASASRAELEDTSAEAYGLLAQGAALVPAGVSADALAGLLAAVPPEAAEPEPEPEPTSAADPPDISGEAEAD